MNRKKQDDDIVVVVLTISRDAVRLAWLRISGIGLLHSCAVLRLSIRCHVL